MRKTLVMLPLLLGFLLGAGSTVGDHIAAAQPENPFGAPRRVAFHAKSAEPKCQRGIERAVLAYDDDDGCPSFLRSHEVTTTIDAEAAVLGEVCGHQKVQLQLWIDSAGRVQQASSSSACVAGIAKGLRFPRNILGSSHFVLHLNL